MGRTSVALLVAGLTLAACSTESNLTERFLLQITSEAPGPGAPTEVESLAGELSHLKNFISLPVFVGFGIRTAEHARTIGKIADGVIVGSAFVENIELASSESKAKKKIITLASAFRDGLDSELTIRE